MTPKVFYTRDYSPRARIQNYGLNVCVPPKSCICPICVQLDDVRLGVISGRISPAKGPCTTSICRCRPGYSYGLDTHCGSGNGNTNQGDKERRTYGNATSFICHGFSICHSNLSLLIPQITQLRRDSLSLTRLHDCKNPRISGYP